MNIETVSNLVKDFKGLPQWMQEDTVIIDKFKKEFSDKLKS